VWSLLHTRFHVKAGSDVRSMLQTAATLKRLPMLMRLFALFPDGKGTKPKQIWGGVVQLEKK